MGILEPHTEILGGPNIFIEEGFTMNLTCVVKDSPEPPQYIFWYRNNQVGKRKPIKTSLKWLTSENYPKLVGQSLNWDLFDYSPFIFYIWNRYLNLNQKHFEFTALDKFILQT